MIELIKDVADEIGREFEVHLRAIPIEFARWDSEMEFDEFLDRSPEVGWNDNGGEPGGSAYLVPLDEIDATLVEETGGYKVKGLAIEYAGCDEVFVEYLLDQLPAKDIVVFSSLYLILYSPERQTRE